MIREGDYVYVHTLKEMDLELEVGRGVYEVTSINKYGVVFVDTKMFFDYILAYNQYYKLRPNKINKLLYKELS